MRNIFKQGVNVSQIGDATGAKWSDGVDDGKGNITFTATADGAEAHFTWWREPSDRVEDDTGMKAGSKITMMSDGRIRVQFA